MNHRVRLALASLVPMTFAACGGAAPESLSESASALSDGVPKRAWLELDLSAVQSDAAAAPAPSSSAPPPATCAGGPPAAFAGMSSDIMHASNGVLDSVMGLIESATSGPPAAQGPDTAVWGPISSPQSPSIYRLTVHQVAPGAFQVELAGTPKSGNQATWVGVMQGAVQSSSNPPAQAGDLTLDFGAAHALDPSTDPSAGGVAIHFQNGAGQRAIDETFSGVVGQNAPQPNDAHYAFSAASNGLTFDYVTRTDFDHDGVLDELLHVEARWLPPGAGKASVTVTGGSIGPNPVAAIECWDPTQATVFYADDVNANPPRGNAACCVQ